MTDCELMKLAAKAAGMSVRESRFQPNELVFEIEQDSWTRWNPLTDDGDALRLAVKLMLDIRPYIYFSDRCQLPAIAKERSTDGPSMIEDRMGRFPEYRESHIQHDSYAATRCAIVRAAAEIGKAMT